MNRARASSGLLAAAVSALLVLAPGSARAAEDDFEFGRRLAQKGYYDYAKRVFDAMAKDEKRSAADRARARYGLALLGKDEALAATRRPDVSYADSKAKFEVALKEIEDFVSKNPNDPQADDARIEAGELRLGVVEWIGRLQTDDKAIAERATTKDALVVDARTYAGKAVEVFGNLRERAKDAAMKTRASFSYAMAQFYRGFAEPACSDTAVVALTEARKSLEDYATANESLLIGMYAMDFLGRADWELAKCRQDPDQRAVDYNNAYQWFEACTNTPNDSKEHTVVIARGFLHLGQLALEAREQGEGTKRTNFLKMAGAAMPRLKDVARATKVPEGVEAHLVWAEIEATLQNGSEAFKVARLASDAAKEIGYDEGVRKANAALRRYVQTANAVDLDPDALLKIAESLFQGQKYDEAIPAYQQVVMASRGDDARVRYALPAWDRIGQSFEKQGLFFEAAAAWDVVVDAWRADPRKGPEDEPKTRVSYGSARGALRAYDELAQKTRDPILQSRVAAIREELPRLFPMVSSAQDQAFAQALTLVNEVIAARAANPGDTSWQAKADRAKSALRETALNVRSDRQDNAWAVLVNFANALQQHEEAVRTADEAFAYWESPHAKKRLLEEGDRVGTNRTLQKARITSEKARALLALDRHDEALALAQGYGEKWPAAEAAWKQTALGVEVQALLAKQRIPEAEALLKRILQDYPGSTDLAKVSEALARQYEAKAEPMEVKLKGIHAALRGTPEQRGLEPRLNALIKSEAQALETVSTLLQGADRQRLIIKTSQAPAEIEAAKKKLAEIEAEIPGAQKELATIQAEKAEVEGKIPPLRAERERLRREAAEPLALAALRYVEWDDAVKAQDEKSERKSRKSENVRGFATRYYKLAGLRPDDALPYWREARRLFEEYFAIPEVKALPDSDPKKRTSLTHLGEAYYALAIAETDPEKARALYEQAVVNLEKGLARVPANTPLIVGLLSGEYVTLPYADPAQEFRTFHFPIPRSADAATFKKNVRDLTPERLVRFDPRRQTEKDSYERALRNFKLEVDKMDDATARRAAESTKTGAFDAGFFASHADASVEALLPLAKAYIRSGTKEGAYRAMNAAQNALLRGPGKPEDGSSEWWQAQTIVLHYFVAEAERAAAAGGTQVAEGARLAKQADKVIVSFKRLFPRIGGAERHEETLAEWKDLHARLQKAAPVLQVTLTTVDLAADTPPAVVEAPPAPAAPATPSAPTAPGGAPPAGTGSAGGSGMETR